MLSSVQSMDLVAAGFGSSERGLSIDRIDGAERSRGAIRTSGSPTRAVSLSLFFRLHRQAADSDRRYPCAAMRRHRGRATVRYSQVRCRKRRSEASDGVVDPIAYRARSSGRDSPITSMCSVTFGMTTTRRPSRPASPLRLADQRLAFNRHDSLA
jgi:hypothetical protein